MDKLTQNFSLHEFLWSDKGFVNGIDNYPEDPAVLDTIQQVAIELQTLRDCFGKPIKINSAFRNAEINSLVKGTKTSYHMYARGPNTGAVDIESEGVPSIELAKLVLDLELEFYGLILECPTNGKDGWLHLSYDPARRITDGQKVLSWVRDSKGTKRYLHGLWERVR